jgi:DNA-binding XRE family transcriptional regulator
MVRLRLDNRIGKILDASGWRESELAFHCEMDQGHLNRIKHGRVQPNLLTALKISRSLELPVRAIFRLRRTEPESEADA